MNKQAWIERAKELGLEGFEITESRRNSRDIVWFESQMDSYTTSRILSTSMRALSNGKIVSISMEKVDDNEMDKVLNSLIEAASHVSESEKDELVPVMENVEVCSLHTWRTPEPQEIKDFLASLEKKFLAADERVTMVNGLYWSNGKFESELTNSLGVHVKDEGESQMVGAQITMMDDGDLRDGFLIELVPDIDTFDQDAFVKKLVDKVKDQLHASSMESTTCPVLFTNETMTTLFSSFENMFSGSVIAKGLSPVSGKVGQKIFSDKITVIDDPKNQDALMLQNYDDEGHPTYEKVVVDKGVFETVLHNTKSALKMNAQSTGNGFKSGGGATDAMAMNMYIVPGKESFDELVKQMDNGVVITDLAGMHAGIDFITTNFSLQAQGYLVENGKKTRPLTLITIAGNFLALMNEVVAVGNDLEWKANTTACPAILFKEAAIGGTTNG